MHRARHSTHSPILRPRVLIALVAAGAGLVVALWLPTRNDNASASENGRSPGQSQSNHHRKHHRHPQPPPALPSFSESPSPTPSESLPPSPSESPTTPPTTAPTTTPPTTAPTTAPTSEAPKATEWAPFTDYVAGQLVTYEGVEYQVQETHTSLPGWEPTALPALFKPVD